MSLVSNKKVWNDLQRDWQIQALQQPKGLEQPQPRENNFYKQDVLIWVIFPKIQQLSEYKTKFEYDDLLQVFLRFF